MSDVPEKYRPSNGTEGDSFIESMCSDCARDKVMNGEVSQADAKDEDYCKILNDTFVYDVDDVEYPVFWIYAEDGFPTCTAHLPLGEKISTRDTLTVDMFA